MIGQEEEEEQRGLVGTLNDALSIAHTQTCACPSPSIPQLPQEEPPQVTAHSAGVRKGNRTAYKTTKRHGGL